MELIHHRHQLLTVKLLIYSLTVVSLSMSTAQNQQLSTQHVSKNGSVLKYTINTTWDGDLPEDNAEIYLAFSKVPVPDNYEGKSGSGSGGLLIEIDAPFYNDPIVPPSLPIGSTDKLWNYEVVEVFFLSESEGIYLETEFAPKGHYLVLQLDTEQNVLKNEMPLENYTAAINEENTRWQGKAVIPLDYLPKNVNKFNAYAIHKSDPDRVYMSLFPVPKGKYPAPNFHRLEYFQSIDISNIIN